MREVWVNYGTASKFLTWVRDGGMLDWRQNRCGRYGEKEYFACRETNLDPEGKRQPVSKADNFYEPIVY
jgi:hypothetical protein